jgi:hypothetical protein
VSCAKGGPAGSGVGRGVLEARLADQWYGEERKLSQFGFTIQSRRSPNSSSSVCFLKLQTHELNAEMTSDTSYVAKFVQEGLDLSTKEMP